MLLKDYRYNLKRSDLSSKLNITGWYKLTCDHISYWDNEILKIGKHSFRFIMTLHVHHWDTMMNFEETTKSLFPSDLFIQLGNHKLLILMISLMT